jgi:hypothetical protein
MAKSGWMKGVFANSHGLFHRQLGIPRGEKIPEAWLRVIVKTKIMGWAKNPTDIGNRGVRVTHLVKERAVPLLTADRINRK